MSVLSYPRIHMKGTCLISPATGNNNDVGINVDVVNAALLPGLCDLSDDDARAWMMDAFPAIGPDDVNVRTYVRSGWNYFGSMQTQFQGVNVTSVVGLDGRLRDDDPIVGRPIEILASSTGRGRTLLKVTQAWETLFGESTPFVCDVDPMGSAMTQLFLGGLSVGDSTLGINASYNTRAFSRWVLFRNASTYNGEQYFAGAGATWQFAIPKDHLKFMVPDDSSVLAELRDAATKARGILVQFCLYQAIPEMTDEVLIEQFARGGTPENPVQPQLVGTLGVWEHGELATAPMGRLLKQPLAWPPAPDIIDPAARFLAPALARVHAERHVVSLNLITTFPEADFDPPYEKFDFGPVVLGYIPASGGDPVPISGPLDYGAATYSKTGGLIDAPYDGNSVKSADLDRGTLVLLARSKSDGAALVILTEEDSARPVATDDCGVYLDVGGSGSISILVRERGGPPSEDVTVYLWEYQYAGGPAGFQRRASFLLTLVEDGPPLEHRLEFPHQVVFPAGWTEPWPIPITACRPGAAALAFTLEDEPLKGFYPWDTAFYAFVRVMPDDNYNSFKRKKRESWDFMYEHVFRYFYLIYPAMSKRIAFNSKSVMELNAKGIVAVTDPKLWHTTFYMPVTRELSSGKRKLIVEWAKSLR